MNEMQLDDVEIAPFPGMDALLAVRVRGAEFGLPVGRVGEVLRRPRITRVPLAPPAVRGVASVRGDVVPVVDLRERLFGERTESDGRIVTIEQEQSGEVLGLLVEEVVGLVEGAAVASEPALPEAVASLPAGLIVRVVTSRDDRLIAELNLAVVFDVAGSAAEEHEESR